MSDTTWSDACFSAINQPLPLLTDGLYASCGLLVCRYERIVSRLFPPTIE
jgi:hypothetical protein